MRIFIACSIDKFSQHRKEYNQIRRQILTDGHELSMDWVNTLEKPLSTKDITLKMSRLLEDAVLGIKSADLVICESSIPSFEIGYIINTSLKYKKPVLNLTKDLDEKSETNNLLDLPVSEYLEEYYYSEKSVEDIIARFIQKYKGGILARFNIILERKQKNYLDWADRFYKQSKSEIIRDMIDKRSKEDIHYQRSTGNVT